MANHKQGERAKAAARDPKPGAQDRPRFDLGGAVEPDNKKRTELPPRGPGASPGRGARETGQADGYTDAGGARRGSESGGGPGGSTP
jgi:hypothetical protein